jgi:hypothetical protein
MWYIDQGINGAAFSDHNNVQGAKRAREFVIKNNLDFWVIIAQEFTNNPEGLHLNVYGIEEDLTPTGYSDPPGPNPMNTSEMITYVKANGGYVTVNHYKKAPGRPYTYEQLRDWGVDGFEVPSSNSSSKFKGLRNFCVDNDLAAMSGSDTHLNYELDQFVRVQINPENRTLDNLFTILKQNQHQIIGMKELKHSKGDEYESFVDYFNTNMDKYHYLSWILWSVGGYTIFILIAKKIKSSDERVWLKKLR